MYEVCSEVPEPVEADSVGSSEHFTVRLQVTVQCMKIETSHNVPH